jgi:hypothetical protein
LRNMTATNGWLKFIGLGDKFPVRNPAPTKKPTNDHNPKGLTHERGLQAGPRVTRAAGIFRATEQRRFK